MKKNLLSALLLFVIMISVAQSPQLMNYQAVVRNAQGQTVANNTPIKLRFTIHDVTPNGASVYSEVINDTVNQFGLANVQIGSGGNLGTISWGNGAKFLQVEVNVNNTNYVDMGTSQLLSVPYALYAANSAMGPQGPRGVTGPQGATGADGTTGATGQNGAPGATGATGPSGVDGLPGATGATGIDGAPGATGATGPSGVDGATGVTGPSGADGAPGATGPVGCNTADYVIKSNGSSAVCGSIYDNGTQVGIGSSSPQATLEISGASGSTLRIVDNNQGAGKVLTSDNTGQASWQTPAVSAGVPTGAVFYLATLTVPAGYLECNGAVVARLSYPALFAAIGTTYGAGDGSTTFGLPDLRGEFLRGIDDGRGVDPSRAFGSAQGFAIQSHTHTVTTYSAMLPQSGSSTPCWYGTATGTSGATGGSETRPTNVALMPVIKY